MLKPVQGFHPNALECTCTLKTLNFNSHDGNWTPVLFLWNKFGSQLHDKEKKLWLLQLHQFENRCSGQCYFLHPKPPGAARYENFALVKNKLLTAGLITAESRADERREDVQRQWVLVALPECNTCVWLWPCSSSRYGQSWGGWMEYCVLLSSLLSVSSLSDSSPSRSPLDLGGQRVSVLARDPPSPSRRAGRLWMWLCSGLVCGLSSNSAGTWLRCSLHWSWLAPCLASAFESKRSISLLLLHSFWPRPKVLSRRVEVTLERLFWSFRACALIPNKDIWELECNGCLKVWCNPISDQLCILHC